MDNVTLPATTLRRIDDYVDEAGEGMTRSGFLATAAQHELRRALRSLSQDVARGMQRTPLVTRLRAAKGGKLTVITKSKAGRPKRKRAAAKKARRK